MWPKISLIGLTIALAIESSIAAATPAPAVQSHRVLVVVEASRTMQRRVEAIQGAVKGVLGTSLGAQLKPGDSLGFWGFNQKLLDNVIPLQTWPTNNTDPVLTRFDQAIGSLRYEREGRLSILIPEITALVKDSELITVLLISSGEGEISGTPFDTELNAYYSQWRSQQTRERNPFVTVLRGHKGKFIHHAVTAYPWKLEVPALPERVPPPPVAQTATAPARTNKPVVPPLIVVGPKRPPPPPQTNVVVSQAALATPPNPPATTNAGPQPGPVPAPATQIVAEKPVTTPSTQAVASPSTQQVATTTPPPEVLPDLDPVDIPAMPEASAEPQASDNTKRRLTRALIIVAGFLMLFLGWMVRRPRKRAHTSLITESLDREDRP